MSVNASSTKRRASPPRVRAHHLLDGGLAEHAAHEAVGLQEGRHAADARELEEGAAQQHVLELVQAEPRALGHVEEPAVVDLPARRLVRLSVAITVFC